VVRKKIHERRIMDCGDSVTDSFNSKQLDSFADFLGSADFTGVHQAVESELGGFVISGAKFRCGDAEFVSTNAEGNDRLGSTAFSSINDAHGGFRAELAKCGEN